MKGISKLLRIVALSSILSLLVVAIPTTPALAYDYDIDLDGDSGEIGDYFYVEGDDWPPTTGTYPNISVSEVDIYFTSFKILGV